MKISRLKKETRAFKKFSKREWELIHPDHYGEKLDWKYWKKRVFRFQAEENGKIVGGISGHIMAGVMYTAGLIVAHDKRGSGIGKTLMEKVEKFALRNGVHLIYLETGVGWQAVKFYESLGFKPATRLKNFFSKKDFYLMTKTLNAE